MIAQQLIGVGVVAAAVIWVYVLVFRCFRVRQPRKSLSDAVIIALALELERERAMSQEWRDGLLVAATKMTAMRYQKSQRASL
jgi:hypothetical protein